MANTFHTHYRVMYHDADSTGHLSIPALGNYVLDTAGLHAIDLGISMRQLAARGMTWVMSGLRFSIHGLPEINSTIDLATQISGYTRISSQRDFAATCNGKPVADISTEWLIIDTTTRRPVFLTDVFPGIEGLLGPNPPLPKYQHLRQAPGAAASTVTRKTVEYSDIDINSHLYSMRYLSMALDTLDRRILSSGSISKLTANFVSEILYGCEVEIITGAAESGAQIIEMRVEGKTMFRAMVAS